MIDEIQIRFADISDIEQMLGIYQFYVEKTSITFDYIKPSIEEYKLKFESLLEQYPVLVAIKNAEIVGFTYASEFRKKKAYQWSVESTVYLKHNILQNGIGTMLYKKMLGLLQLQHIIDVIAVITTPNLQSENFHTKLGFISMFELPEFGYKFNTWHSIKFFKLAINSRAVQPSEPISIKALKEKMGIEKLLEINLVLPF